jgi:hypothetical protein
MVCSVIVRLESNTGLVVVVEREVSDSGRGWHFVPAQVSVTGARLR